jgi:hypothetical protein
LKSPAFNCYKPAQRLAKRAQTLQKARTRKLAAWVRESILQLGPTFIKVGQLFSTRSDLFPIEFVEELSKLQVGLCERAPLIFLGSPLFSLFWSISSNHSARLHSIGPVSIGVYGRAL